MRKRRSSRTNCSTRARSRTPIRAIRRRSQNCSNALGGTDGPGSKRPRRSVSPLRFRTNWPHTAEPGTVDAPRFGCPRAGGQPMNKDEMKGKADQVKGRAKQAWGDLTNNEQTREEGIKDEARGEVQEGIGKARRKVGDVLHDIEEKVKE